MAAARCCAALTLLLLTQHCCAWIPFIGEETHKHLQPNAKNGEWDLLQLLSLNASQAGVTEARKGPRNVTSYVLKEAYSSGHVSHALTHQIFSELHADVSVMFTYQQLNNTVAPLITASMPGSIKPWFQVNSDLRRRRLQVVYRLEGDRTAHQATFPLSKKVGAAWTKLLVSLSGTQIKVWVNCDSVVKRPLDGVIDLRMPDGGLLFFSQEQHYKNKLLGAIQTAKIFNFPMSSRLWRCTFDEQFGPSWRPPLIG